MTNFGNGQKKMFEERKHKYISLLFIVSFIVCVSAVPVDLFAQSTPGSRIPPERWEKKKPTRKPPLPSQRVGVAVDPAKEFRLPPLDEVKLLQEDNARGHNGPARLGVYRKIGISPLTHGEWYDIDSGKGKIWLMQIHSPHA